MLDTIAIFFVLPIYVVGMIVIRFMNLFRYFFDKKYVSQDNPYFDWENFCMQYRFHISIGLIALLYLSFCIAPYLTIIK